MTVKNMLRKYFSMLKGDLYQTAKLCGVPLNVIKGTIRARTDQDDTWWFYLSKHHDVIFDIGCNIGYTALLALIQKPDRQMVLVDPNPKALQKAAANLIANGLGSKVCYQSAFVGNSVGDSVTFFTVGSGAAGSMHASHAKTAASINTTIQVQTVTLDYLFDYYGLLPDLVKIDVEGAETLVMEGSKQLARETQCSFFIEMHEEDHLSMEAAGQIMLNWCEEMDYKAWYLKTGEELITASTIKNRGKCHLLLMPETAQYPEYLKGVSQNAPLPILL